MARSLDAAGEREPFRRNIFAYVHNATFMAVPVKTHIPPHPHAYASKSFRTSHC